MKWARIPFVDLFLEASDKEGKIRCGITKKPIKIYTRTNKYQHFSTFVNDKSKTVYVHRCVLSAHAPIEGYKKLQVHHKDHNPENNNLSNLVWCTASENLLYSLKDGRLEYSKQKASENSRNQLRKGTHAFFNLTPEQHKLKYINRSNNYQINKTHHNKGRNGLNATNVKLTQDKIKKIMELHESGMNMSNIAKNIGLSITPIRNVIKGIVKYI